MNTKTQLAAWSKGLSEAALLAAVVATPLIVNYQGFRAFELPKAAVALAFALLAAVAGVIALIESGEATAVAMRAALRQGVVRAALAVLVVEVVAAAASIVPKVSFFGSPERAEGLLTLLACAVFFGVTVAVGRVPARRMRLVGTLIAASVPVAVYALTQAAQLEVIPGKVEAALRVFGTLSNPIFLGAYLMLLVPLTLWRLGAALTDGRPFVAGGYSLVVVVQLTALALTGSRGPLVGLLAGLVVLGVGWAAATGRRRAVVWSVGAGTGVAVFLAVLAMPGTPLAGLRDAPVIGRLAQIGETQTGSQAVRLGIWRAVARTMQAPANPNADSRPLNAPVHLQRGLPMKWLFGHGQEMQRYVMLPFGDTYMGGRAQADRLVDRAHDVPFDVLLTTGLPGLAARLWLWAAWLATCVAALGLAADRRARTVLFALLGAGAAAGAVTWAVLPALAGPVAALGLAVGLGAYLVWAGWRAAAEPRPVNGLALALLAVGSAAVVEAAFGIETVVTQLVFWVLAGLVVAVALGDVAERAVEPAAARRSAGRTKHASGDGSAAEGGAAVHVGMRWSPGGAALGLIGALAMSAVIDDLLIPGAPLLAHTRIVLGLLVIVAFAALLLAVVDARESVGAYLLFSLTGAALWTFMRTLILLAAQPTAADPTRVAVAVLWAMFVLWIVFLALGAGVFLRGGTSAQTPIASGPAVIAYPVLGVGAVVVMMLLSVRPVQGDLFFQAAYDDFQVALQGDQEALFQRGEQRFDRAVALQPRDDIMYLKWSELYANLGELMGQSGQTQSMATALNKAQVLLGQAEAINPAMLLHVFNRGHVQLLAAQILAADPAQAPNAAQVAQNAELALQQAFDILTYDPQVANELALAKLLQPAKAAEGLALLEYSRDSLDDANVQTYRLLAAAYKQSGDTEKSDAALVKAGELGGGDDPALLLRKGDEAREAGDFITARANYERARQMLGARADWKVLFNLGLLYRDSGDPTLAAQTLSEAMRIAPADAQNTVQDALMKVLTDGAAPPAELGQPDAPAPSPQAP